MHTYSTTAPTSSVVASQTISILPYTKLLFLSCFWLFCCYLFQYLCFSLFFDSSIFLLFFQYFCVSPVFFQVLIIDRHFCFTSLSPSLLFLSCFPVFSYSPNFPTLLFFSWFSNIFVSLLSFRHLLLSYFPALLFLFWYSDTCSSPDLPTLVPLLMFRHFFLFCFPTLLFLFCFFPANRLEHSSWEQSTKSFLGVIFSGYCKNIHNQYEGMVGRGHGQYERMCRYIHS